MLGKKEIQSEKLEIVVVKGEGQFGLLLGQLLRNYHRDLQNAGL